MNDLLRCVTQDEGPRILLGHHDDDCTDPDTCRGCRPCPEHHCGACTREHVTGTYICPGCIHDARTTIRAILSEITALPAEVIIKGVNSEAFNLNGPAADPEARWWITNEATTGRLAHRAEDWLTEADSDTHPLIALGDQAMKNRDLLEQTDVTDLVTIDSEANWLLDNLHLIAAHPDNDFRELLHKVHRCLSHLEAVLHDGEQRDRGAPCPSCGKPLVKVYSETVADWWECARCKIALTAAEYAITVRDNADWLPDTDAAARTGIDRSTIRSWALRGHVKKKTLAGRIVYRIADIITKKDAS